MGHDEPEEVWLSISLIPASRQRILGHQRLLAATTATLALNVGCSASDESTHGTSSSTTATSNSSVVAAKPAASASAPSALPPPEPPPPPEDCAPANVPFVVQPESMGRRASGCGQRPPGGPGCDPVVMPFVIPAVMGTVTIGCRASWKEDAQHGWAIALEIDPKEAGVCTVGDPGTNESLVKVQPTTNGKSLLLRPTSAGTLTVTVPLQCKTTSKQISVSLSVPDLGKRGALKPALSVK